MNRGNASEERTCRGTIDAVTVDNLRVPQGATCILSGTHVEGTVKVERDATLLAVGIRVVGNVQGENAARVAVTASRNGGSVQVKQGGGAELVDGNLQCKENVPPPTGTGNVVEGNAEDQCAGFAPVGDD